MKVLPPLEQLKLFGEEEVDKTVEVDEESLLVDEEETVPYEIGDRVQVVNEANEDSDPETHFYLKDFERKKGLVEKVTFKPKLQYHVRFGDNLAIVYHHELTI